MGGGPVGSKGYMGTMKELWGSVLRSIYGLVREILESTLNPAKL